ncbi:hypothetical protein RUM44_010660 [Polyplax serrata]|uniref:Chitin-binding type-4 domain-containing protein n=1 Tax=Polyplax serrata TaxID=468196 RepID=A0ABR1AN51_POLSC
MKRPTRRIGKNQKSDASNLLWFAVCAQIDKIREYKKQVPSTRIDHTKDQISIGMKESVSFIFLLLSGTAGVTNGHGMLWDPPGRSSLWRFGYKTPPNYDDNQLYCGGIGAQMEGKFMCGICGDSYGDPIPRNNELGGLYGLGIITRLYPANSVVPVVVDLETQHRGYFEFHLCDLTGRSETEDCFRKLLYENGSDKFFVRRSQFYYLTIRLPKGIRCKHCVLRWHYKTGNNWGTCKNGTQALGCGPQEIFRNCADISIQ